MTQTTTAPDTQRDEILTALQRSWRGMLREVDSGTEHMAIERAVRHASRHERETRDWYAAAINHYLDR